MIRSRTDVSRATSALWDLQRATGRSIASIMRDEVQAVLQLTMDRTRAASLAALRKAVERRVRRALAGRTPLGARVTVNIRKHPGRAWYIGPDGSKKMMNDGTYRWSDETYQDYLAADFAMGTPDTVRAEVQKILRKEMVDFRKRRGIAKQTWLLLARAMGLQLRAPNYVRDAAIPRVDNAANVTARVENRPTRIVYEGRNRSPVANSAGARGKAAIDSALRGRMRLIREALQGGMSHAAQAIRKKYGLR